MTTYDYRILQKPTEEDLNKFGGADWRVIQTGTDPRDGALVWALMERAKGSAKETAGPRPATQEKRR